MFDKWDSLTVKKIDVVVYVKAGMGRMVHKDRPSHGFVLNAGDSEKTYVFSDGRESAMVMTVKIIGNITMIISAASFEISSGILIFDNNKYPRGKIRKMAYLSNAFIVKENKLLKSIFFIGISF